MCAALQDTEFPGVVAKPIGSFKSSSDFHYQTLRCNVDLLKIIQLGLTFSTDEGELAPGVCTYQFNFKFSLAEDIYAQDSIGARTRPGLPPPAAPSPATPSADDDALLLVGRRSADSLGHRLPPSRGREPGAACHPHCTRSLPPTDPPTLHALLTAHRRLRPDGGHVCCASVRPVARALICAAARPLVSQYGSDVTYFAELLISYLHVHTYPHVHTYLHVQYGIDVTYFAELLISSGCVLTDEVKWVSFHSGYDFGYLMKILTCSARRARDCKPRRRAPIVVWAPRSAATPAPRTERLAAEEDDFFSELKLFFPCFYDIKYLMKACEGLKGGLNKLAEDLEVERIGPEHQAGSDSLLTQATFYKMRSLFFEGIMDDERHMNILYGLERGANLIKGGRETVNVSSSAASAAGAASAAASAAATAAAPTGGGSATLPFEESSA